MDFIDEKRYQELLEHYNASKDLVMKEVEKDARFMSWIAWGIGALYPEKSPKEMFSFMKNATEEELSKRIRRESEELKDFSTRGFILDVLDTLLDEEDEVTSYLNVDNHINYVEKENRPRALSYLCAMQFKEGNYYKTEKFSDIREANSVWVFPSAGKLKNRIEVHKFEDIFRVDDAESLEPEETGIEGNVDKMTAYFFFLGDPEKIKFDSKKLPEEVIKRRILLYLLDSMFNLNIPTEKKLKYLEKFYLTGTQIKKGVNLVQNLAQEINDFFVSVFGETPEEIDQLKKKNAEQAEEILSKDKVISSKDKVISSKDEEILSKDKEIEKLKALLAQK